MIKVVPLTLLSASTVSRIAKDLDEKILAPRCFVWAGSNPEA